MPLMSHQDAGKWTTPYGPNVRYTIQFHVTGEDESHAGSMRAVDRHVVCRIVTPLGEHKAVATAATHFKDLEPDAIYSEVEVIEVEHEFTVEPNDYRDRESFGR
jgi:hypothetical protein